MKKLFIFVFLSFLVTNTFAQDDVKTLHETAKTFMGHKKLLSTGWKRRDAVLLRHQHRVQLHRRRRDADERLD
jgi:hypothetical protein